MFNSEKYLKKRSKDLKYPLDYSKEIFNFHEFESAEEMFDEFEPDYLVQHLQLMDNIDDCLVLECSEIYPKYKRDVFYSCRKEEENDD